MFQQMPIKLVHNICKITLVFFTDSVNKECNLAEALLREHYDRSRGCSEIIEAVESYFVDKLESVMLDVQKVQNEKKKLQAEFIKLMDQNKKTKREEFALYLIGCVFYLLADVILAILFL